MNKNYTDYALYCILFLALAALVLVFVSWPNRAPAAVPASDTGLSAASNAFKAVYTGTTEQGDVEIELTPSWANGKLEVNVAANTHSVDLSGFNLKEITALQYGGKTLKPVSAPALSGHHASGKLVFDTEEKQDNFVIRILGIPAVDERVFEW